jgi:conjugative relaxase-like TrwC/TraI family protein
MAWMAMLGADSVDYHRDNVVARGDDHPGQALAYYASRGETPLVWGGNGAERFGLSGAVTDAQYTAVFGPAGACDPTTGERLVTTRRPGIDLVVSAHKSVAELGVIGRTEDMHAILDAERDATMGYLDEMVRAMGGRRGRARVTTATDGLIYAHTRHATSRAGDPCPHDHVLVANLVAMRDERGGLKALDTVQVRDHLHAATMVGRLAAARKALDLGYAIEPDHGASGRLGHWRIVGIPTEVEALHSKRSEEIHAHLARRGFTGWRARQVAARKTREVKRHTPVTELLPVWQAELVTAGWSPEQLVTAVTEAGDRRTVPERLDRDEIQAVVAAALDPDGPLARAKVFHRRDVVVAVTPHLFGRPADCWYEVVSAVLASPDVIPLMPLAGARGRAWSLASVIATEQAIAETVARGTAAQTLEGLPVTVVTESVINAEARLGHRLTNGQRTMVTDICRSGERVSLVLGVAGAGKTTALRCVADVYRRAGYEVIGTATSGQAARTLGREANLVHSRTLASLCWRLDHGDLVLHHRTVVMLDEAGMTDDPDLLRLLVACEIARAKVVLVGDDRQLSAVGPGGGLGALLERFCGYAHVLDENLRQRDRSERATLAELRAGDVGRAVDWYLGHDRVHVSPNRDGALASMVDAWATDALAGRDVAMYAWQRRNVDGLNELARERWLAEGRLGGPELVAAGGRRYQAGDWIVTLSPGRDTVTSERGTVAQVRPEDQTAIVRMDDGRFVRLTAEELDRDHLAHGYAVTVHRAQGATVDVAYRFEDGGGRELAYVAMSRARDGSHCWLVADDIDQAREDLTREWSAEARARWVIDTGTPDLRPRRPWHEPERVIDRAKVEAERRALLRAIPPDVRPAIIAVNHRLAAVDQAERDLETGDGIWSATEIGRAASRLQGLRRERRRYEDQVARSHLGWRERRRLRAEVQRLAASERVASTEFEDLVHPIRVRLREERQSVKTAMGSLKQRAAARNEWLSQHPEVEHRLGVLSAELTATERMPARMFGRDPMPTHQRELAVEPHVTIGEVDQGLDLGL